MRPRGGFRVAALVPIKGHISKPARYIAGGIAGGRTAGPWSGLLHGRPLLKLMKTNHATTAWFDPEKKVGPVRVDERVLANDPKHPRLVVEEATVLAVMVLFLSGAVVGMISSCSALLDAD